MTKRKLSTKVRRHPCFETIVAIAAIGALRFAALVPYQHRVPLGGWMMRRIASPLLGYPSRIRNNLSMVLPHLSAAEQKELAQQITDHIGRTITEIFSPVDLIEIGKGTPLSGPGLAAVTRAQAACQPVIFVSGHIGNYDIWRAALNHRGMELGALYRQMRNARFNDYYVLNIEAVSKPMFPRGQRGLAEMVRFLRDGNAVALLVDQHVIDGAPLQFFGETAYTALSAAELAIKYNALLVPIYALRKADGLSFDIIIEEPIAQDDPATMMQYLNDSLEAQVRRHMSQWFWVHRRWKAPKRAAQG